MQARSSWWHNFFWYQIWEGDPGEKFGLLYPDESPKPSWYAYRDYTAANPAPQMISINLSTTDIEDDITRVEVGDGDSVDTTQASRRCRKNVDPNSDYYIYFAVDDGFAYQGDRSTVTVLVDYYDGGAGSVMLQYDSASGPYTSAGSVAVAGVNTWKRARFNLNDAYFGNRQNNGADFRISGGVGNTFYLDIVAVTATPRPPGPASDPNPPHLATGVDINVDLSWSTGSGATSHDVYFGPANPPPFQQNQTATTYHPGTLAAGITYYWQINEINDSGTTAGSVWSFTTLPLPGQASNPNPNPGATGVDIDADLTWTAGAGATSHDIYFSTTDPPGYQTNQTAAAYDPGTLNYNTVYYWQINEVNTSGSTPGIIWNFTTARFDGDFDADGDTDQEDFGLFQLCYTHGGIQPGCENTDFNADGQIDLQDFNQFANCLAGPNNPPGC
jgi:hypothetical protein